MATRAQCGLVAQASGQNGALTWGAKRASEAKTEREKRFNRFARGFRDRADSVLLGDVEFSRLGTARMGGVVHGLYRGHEQRCIPRSQDGAGCSDTLRPDSLARQGTRLTMRSPLAEREGSGACADSLWHR